MFRFNQEKKNDFTKDLPLKKRQELNARFKENAFSFRQSVYPVGAIIVLPISGKKYQVQPSGEWTRYYEEGETPVIKNKKERRIQKVFDSIEGTIKESARNLQSAIIESCYSTRDFHWNDSNSDSEKLD